jgi:hypothetical protein
MHVKFLFIQKAVVGAKNLIVVKMGTKYGQYPDPWIILKVGSGQNRPDMQNYYTVLKSGPKMFYCVFSSFVYS